MSIYMPVYIYIYYLCFFFFIANSIFNDKVKFINWIYAVMEHTYWLTQDYISSDLD